MGVKMKTEPKEEMHLSKCTKISYGVGHVLNDLCSSLWFTYALIFYQSVAGLSPINAGGLLLLGQVVDAFATPVIGVISDRGNCKFKYGKRKSWHLIGTVFVLCSIPFMFSPPVGLPNLNEIFTSVYYGAFIAVFQTAWAFIQISHLSLAPDLTPIKDERTQLLSLRTTFAVLSNLSVYSVAWGVLAVQSSGTSISPKDMKNFQIITYSICAIGALTSIIFHVSVKETEPDESLLGEDGQLQRKSYKQIFSKFSLYLVALLYLSSRLYGNMIQSLIPLYIHNYLHVKAEAIAAVPFAMYAASFAASFVAMKLNTHLGRKVSMFFAGVLALAGVVWIFFGTGYYYSNYYIYLVAILIGSAQSIYLITSLAIIADFIGNDIGNSAFIYGIMSFTDKLSSGLTIMGVQALEKNSGDAYYCYATVLACGAAAILATGTTLVLRLPQGQPTVVIAPEEPENEAR